MAALAARLRGGVGSRIKDLTMLRERRENQLVGYGFGYRLAGDGIRIRFTRFRA